MILVRTNIYKRKERNGQATWMVRWKDPSTGKWRAARGGRTRAEAIAFETRVREHLLRGEDPAWAAKPAVPRPSLSEVADTFYKQTLFLSGSADWRAAVQSKIENEIKPALGKVPFDELDSERIYGFYLTLKAESDSDPKGRSNATLHKYHAVMSHLGEAYGKLTGSQQNPVKKCEDFRKRFPLEASTRPINFLAPEELELIYAETRKSRNRLLFPLTKFLANSGLRRSEALALKWSDIDERSGFIHIRESKNGKSRTIPLEPEAKQALTQFSRRSEFVFVNAQGESYYRDSFLKPLKNAAKRAEINKRIDIHTLRHSYGSNKIRMGWGLKKVSMILGHASIEITSKIYTHLLDGDLKVSDDVRLGFDKKIESADIGNAEETAHIMAHALAKTLTEKLTASPRGREALAQIIEILPSTASSGEIQHDSTMSVQDGRFATPVLRKNKKRPEESSEALCSESNFESSFRYLDFSSNGGSDGTRTHDLRRDRATL